VLVLAAQASLTPHLVTHALLATVIQHQYGPGWAMAIVVALVVALVVVGEGGELMDTLGDRFWNSFRR
jgi:putative copper export protein